MKGKVLNTLEFNKIIDMLTDEATSEPGKERCRALLPMTDRDMIESMQQETGDALSMLISKGGTTFGGNKDIGYAVKALKIKAPLSAAELLNIAGLLTNVSRIKAYGEDVAEDNSLFKYFSALSPLNQISDEILRCILSEEEIADDASAELKRIRREIISTGDKIHTTLNKMVNESLRTYLQDAVITQRDGRYCIPVKAEYKSNVRGMIHDRSSTGSTLFIEPEAVVNYNNALKELSLKEKEEIARILRELSLECSEHTDELIENQRIMTELDFIFARGALALSMNATRPIFNKKHRIKLRKGRHPLLKKDKVVPIDIGIGDEFDLLVITGPNTGGKTVSLKTVGLLALMGQAGLHIPALDRSELSVFTKIFADIGDEQSIEQSLSTFSSHMKNIVTILKYADEGSLCLFDELGAGTDPTEGAALAIAILNALHKRHIRTIATTHYSELKVYALENEGVENACCEFDIDTLSPTYRLLIGVPGKSNAFAISKKLGLPESIISEAKSQIDVSEKSFEDLLTELEERRVSLERDREDTAEYKARIKELQDNLYAKNEKINIRRDSIIRQANAEAREILEEAKRTADETIRVFQNAGPGATMRELEKERDKIRSAINKKDKTLELKAKEIKPEKKINADELKIGDAVKIVSMDMDGTVSSLPDGKGNLYVMCGPLRTKTNIGNLIRIDDEIIKEKDKERERIRVNAANFNRTKDKSKGKSKALSVSTELNLLGKTVDEALPELDKYLDDAYLSHLPSVRIVHGKGTGTLRQAVQRYLKSVRYVKEFRLGEYGEGDAGVTIVTFKD